MTVGAAAVVGSYILADFVPSLIYSATAVAVALVMATKELIVCAFGGLLRSSSGMMSTGDLVEIGLMRGTVQRAGVFTTRLVERDDIDGGHDTNSRTITIPNGRFFEDCVLVRSARAEAVVSRFVLTFEPSRPLREIAAWWDMRAEEYGQACATVSGDARRERTTIATTFATTAMAKPCLHVTLCAPAVDVGAIQRDLTIDFYDWLSCKSQPICEPKHGRSRSGDVVLELVS